MPQTIRSHYEISACFYQSVIKDVGNESCWGKKPAYLAGYLQALCDISDPFLGAFGRQENQFRWASTGQENVPNTLRAPLTQVHSSTGASLLKKNHW